MAFADHILVNSQKNEKVAKSLYKRAIKRSECPMGAFNMLLSIYLQRSRTKGIEYLKQKVE